MDKGKTTVFITVLIILCAGQVSASFKKCYGSCLEDCYAAAGERIACAVKCLFKCKKSEDPNGLDPRQLGCVADQCARFGNYVDKVEDCVNKFENSKCKPLRQAGEHGPNSIPS
ncbi:hypothetical protein CDL12_30470 [Handroanthus impetiginosus]|uniref:Uncharacterized protein n=1 Tax=Handroanthus impetiginosus TaxID=429701 RepID=A0A2G9FVE6_9LAMI|nr:hypothetical protein CDL12_30470 [Handroanthus impetiginosus]